ncbi:MAG TPA: hypothetical protein VF775_04200 [Geobacteraceae bacterium]
MKTNHCPKDATRIAVPYYGALSLPPSGLSRVFFMVEVTVGNRSVDNISLQVWNPKKEPNLSTWLRQLGTDGVICSDNPSQYEVALNSEGIWVQWKQDGEVHEVIERWLQSKPESAQKLSYESDESGIPCTLKPAWQAS